LLLVLLAQDIIAQKTGLHLVRSLSVVLRLRGRLSPLAVQVVHGVVSLVDIFMADLLLQGLLLCVSLCSVGFFLLSGFFLLIKTLLLFKFFLDSSLFLFFSYLSLSGLLSLLSSFLLLMDFGFNLGDGLRNLIHGSLFPGGNIIRKRPFRNNFTIVVLKFDIGLDFM
jgi:hypothetical protein